MRKTGFTVFLETVFRLLAANSVDRSIHDICMECRHMNEMLEAGRNVYSELKNICVRNKTTVEMGSFYALNMSRCSCGKTEVQWPIPSGRDSDRGGSKVGGPGAAGASVSMRELTHPPVFMRLRAGPKSGPFHAVPVIARLRPSGLYRTMLF